MIRPLRLVSATAIALLVTIGDAQNPYPARILPTGCQPGGSGTIATTGNAMLVDLDQDGDDDLVGFVPTTGSPTGISVCMAAGGTFLPGVCYPAPAGTIPSRLAASDLDLDGDTDVVVAYGSI